MRRVLLPPVLPALFTIGAGVVDRTTWRVELLPAPWPIVAGSILMATAVGMIMVAYIGFRQRDESLAPLSPTRRLVSGGLYGVSRNPVYLAFLVFIAGIGCASNSGAVLLALIPAFAAFNWYTIPYEEAYLRRALGAEYDEYAARVRRWI